MDDKDLEILKLMQSNARLTAEAMGYEIGLSPPAVQKRLKKLRETGVIENEIAVLSPSKLGREMTVIVQVMLERESRMHLDAFKRSMQKAPAVQQCYYTTARPISYWSSSYKTSKNTRNSPKSISLTNPT